MARLARVTQKIFAGSAANNGVFGSAQASGGTLSNVLSTIMGLSAWANGWLDAVIGGSKFPPLEEFQSVEYVHSTQIAYLLQQGIAEYDAGTTYWLDNIVCKPGTTQLYASNIDNNTGNALGAAVSNADWIYLGDLASLGTSSTIKGYRKLAGAWASNTTATWTAESLVAQNSSNQPVQLNAYNQTLNIATAGAGGLDTGAIAANTWYYVFAIYNPTGPTTSIIMSLSSSAPTLPAGYTSKIRIGAVYLDGSSHIRGFLQEGPDVQHVVGNNLPAPIIISSGSQTIWTAVSVASVVPTTASRIMGTVGAGTNSENGVAPNNSYNTNFSSQASGPVISNSGTSVSNCYLPYDFVLESSNIYVGGAFASNFVTCIGYKENF